MMIQVEGRVLNNPKWYPVLDVIVDLMADKNNRHSFDVREIHEIESSQWVSDHNGTRKGVPEFLRSSARTVGLDGGSNAVILRIDDNATHPGEEDAPGAIRIHPYGALRILIQPLHVIVEDESSDGAFVLWMARALGRDAISGAYASGRLVFRHAGGKGQMEKSARALTFGVWPRPNRPILQMRLRVAALLDSDSCFPGDFPNKLYVDRVEPEVAFLHVLAGRTIENYVPLKYASRRLKADGLAGAAQCFERLTSDQRQFFPIKRGFKDGQGLSQSHAAFLADVERDAREKDHFRNVVVNDWRILAEGFGTRFADVYQETDYRCNRSEQGLLSSQQKSELDAFLMKVVRHL
jgi:hypothetical protein